MSLIKMFDRPVAFQRPFVSLGCGITGALLLSQACYWQNRVTSKDGFFYKTANEWEEETGLTRREQETARKRLKDIGVLEEVLRGVPAKVNYRVNAKALKQALDVVSMAESAKLDETEAPNCDGGKRQTNTESTTESTTESNNQPSDDSCRNNHSNDQPKEPSPDKPKKGFEYPEEFEWIWKNKPPRSGSNPKRSAYKACKARLKDYTWRDMAEGMKRYIEYVRAAGNLNTVYVMQMSTFFGPDEHFTEEWSVKGLNNQKQGWPNPSYPSARQSTNVDSPITIPGMRASKEQLSPEEREKARKHIDVLRKGFN